MTGSASASGHNWRELHRAALFENDDRILPSRLAEAEKAFILRERELFEMSDDNVEEKEAVNDALYTLQALRSCLEFRTRNAAVARKQLRSCGM